MARNREDSIRLQLMTRAEKDNALVDRVISKVQKNPGLVSSSDDERLLRIMDLDSGAELSKSDRRYLTELARKKLNIYIEQELH